MRIRTHLIGIHAAPELVAEVDRHLGRGHPGDAGYFATRSDLMKCALRQLLNDLDDPDAPTIRQRSPGATRCNAGQRVTYPLAKRTSP